MTNKMLLRFLLATALLIFAVPVVASAQVYDRYRYDRYSAGDRDNLRNAISRLDSASLRLESDLRQAPRARRVLGLFWVTERNESAIAEIRDFRRSVRQLRRASDNGRDLRNSYDEARMVVDQGIRLDRYWRLRTGRTDVDAELSEIRSNLHIIAEAYNLNIRF